MGKKLLEDFDELISQKEYPNRSEAVRDLIRDRLVEEEWRTEKKIMIGKVTLIYSHHNEGGFQILQLTSNTFSILIISTMHVHLDEDNSNIFFKYFRWRHSILLFL